jgi:Uma2 family endonuclease
MTISVEEYLNTSYRPDCDHVDGEVRERHCGERDLSAAMRDVLLYLCGLSAGQRERTFLTLRVRVNATRVRVPDVCITRHGAPEEQVVETAPELCIEILSPEDTMTRTLEKINDYFAMGVPVCWILDPISRQGWVATPGKLEDAVDGILRANGIEMPAAEVLAE